MANATIRDLRNHFSKVKELVETEREVVVTDKGKPKYKLTLYTLMCLSGSRPEENLRRMRPCLQNSAVRLCLLTALCEPGRPGKQPLPRVSSCHVFQVRVFRAGL